jgi:carbamoyl-phosphate synthase small subunit
MSRPELVAPRRKAALALADGTVFEGDAIGALATGDAQCASGELVFNTSMSGYQEIITDPSYAGQVIAFTYPHIGNYGVTRKDEESRRPFCRGIVVRELTTMPSNWRSEGDLEAFLTARGVGGLSGVDTRRLTRHIREAGAMPCAFGTVAVDDLIAAARREPGTSGVDLVKEVTTDQSYTTGNGPYRVVAYDYGIKEMILQQLGALATVEVVPAGTTALEVLERRPDGVFLSNGPGDPAILGHLVAEIELLLGKVPIFGICLGHQLLAAALGGTTFKLAFGHHGANHPVQRLATGTVEVTAQNHGFAVTPDSVSDIEVTHVNLNDGVIEGLRSTEVPAFSVQYHPEAAPGPHDARYLFSDFAQLMDSSLPSGTARR